MNWHSSEIRALARAALEEDKARRDITTYLLIPGPVRIEAAIVAKQTGVLCGLPLAQAIYKALAPKLRFKPSVREGASVRNGQTLAILRGSARSILSGERAALNAMQHLSGIATYTHEQAQRLGRTKTILLDTRKTLPGWRALQKYAVKCGGGTNHRSNLAESILIKDNHLKICRLAGLDWKRAARRKGAEIEVQTEKDLHDVLALKPAKILLDNLPPTRLRRFIRAIRRASPRTKIEISGGVRPDQLRVLGRLGADFISMGRLTHFVTAFDCSLDIRRVL